MVILAVTAVVTAISAAKTENKLLDRIEALKRENDSLRASGNNGDIPDTNDTGRPAENKMYTYLALGNSITKHAKCDYWWNECGMAASAAEKDYFHLIASRLETEYGELRAAAYNFSAWEITAADRAQTLLTLDSYLAVKPDLITLQLSENVTDMTDFASDFRYMLDWLSEKCPDSVIIVIDEFWDAVKSGIKKDICSEKGILFADLSEIRGVKEYQSDIGAIVYDDSGEPHTVNHMGVAGHPGDKGMQYIAESVLALLGKE